MNSNGKYTLDRFEGKYAVLLYRSNEKQLVNIEKYQLPTTAKEGDILDIVLKDGNIKTATILAEETKQAQEAADNLLKKLKNK